MRVVLVLPKVIQSHVLNPSPIILCVGIYKKKTKGAVLKFSRTILGKLDTDRLLNYENANSTTKYRGIFLGAKLIIIFHNKACWLQLSTSRMSSNKWMGPFSDTCVLDLFFNHYVANDYDGFSL